VGAAATAAALALAGVPPLSLWATKDEVLVGVEGPALRVVGLAAAVVSAVYAGRILAVLLAQPAGEERDTEERGTRRVPAATTAVAGVLAAFAAGLGVLALPAAAEALKALLDAEGQPAPAIGDLLLSGGLAVVTLVLTVAALRAGPALALALERSPLASWAGLRSLLSPRPALAVARVLAAVDHRVVDRAVRALASGARQVAGALSRADDGGIDRAVWGVAATTRRVAARSARVDGGVVDGAVRATARAVRRAGAAARRPQTGLLHQYYVQAVAGLGVLLVLLLVVR
ncbi:MAG: NADH-quinone oxidoreductase subunit L, partial [Actinomycetota bacterium]|nr:NADH-quinone oxidoreductase subunit L [Actinomycetota bacterium]